MAIEQTLLFQYTDSQTQEIPIRDRVNGKEMRNIDWVSEWEEKKCLEKHATNVSTENDSCRSCTIYKQRIINCYWMVNWIFVNHVNIPVPRKICAANHFHCIAHFCLWIISEFRSKWWLLAIASNRKASKPFEIQSMCKAILCVVSKIFDVSINLNYKQNQSVEQESIETRLIDQALGEFSLKICIWTSIYINCNSIKFAALHVMCVCVQVCWFMFAPHTLPAKIVKQSTKTRKEEG